MYLIKLQKYLNKINRPYKNVNDLTDEQQKEYLYSIYNAHVKTFPYSNFELRRIAHQHILRRQSLSFFSYSSLLSDRHDGDGYCFQTALLLADALNQLGFKPEFCSARGLIGAAVNAPEVLSLPRTHFVLTLTLGNEQLFLDPGLASSSPRYPIVINGKDESIIQGCDEFKFYFFAEHEVYVLEKKTSQGWYRLLQTDLKPVNQKEVQNNLLKLERHPQPIIIRDKKTVVGILTDEGRKSIYWDEQSDQLKFSKYEGNNSIHELVPDFEAGCNLLKTEFGIHHVSAEMLKEYCSVATLPKPLKAWTIEFPIDDEELNRLDANLSF